MFNLPIVIPGIQSCLSTTGDDNFFGYDNRLAEWVDKTWNSSVIHSMRLAHLACRFDDVEVAS